MPNALAIVKQVLKKVIQKNFPMRAMVKQVKILAR